MNPYIDILLRTAGVYLFIIAAIRLFGKSELTQLTVFDLVFILLISNSVQNAMVGPDSSLLGGLIAASALFILNYLLKRMSFSWPMFNKFLQGEPVLLVHDGKAVMQNLRKFHITYEELEAAMREHGVAQMSDVNLAVLETDGNISILSDNYAKRTARKRKAHRAVRNE